MEHGCRIEEANKDGQSVGIQDSDREGNVSLDACIMDYNGIVVQLFI